MQMKLDLTDCLGALRILVSGESLTTKAIAKELPTLSPKKTYHRLKILEAKGFVSTEVVEKSTTFKWAITAAGLRFAESRS